MDPATDDAALSGVTPEDAAPEQSADQSPSEQDSSGAESPPNPAEALAELRDVVLGYFRQEAVDPLKRLGAWLGFGLAGGVFMATGLVLLALALLRALQTETGGHLSGSLSWTPYAIVLAAVLVVFLLARAAARARRKAKTEPTG